MKSRLNLKSLFLTIIFSTVFFASSCSNSLQTKGNLSFSISKPVLNSIAVLAADEVSDKDLAIVNLEITLFDAENNRNIGKDSKIITLKELVDNPTSQNFNFKKIEIGTIVYAKALVTVTYEGETKELCSGESDKVTVEAANSSLTIKLSINKKDRAYYLNEALPFEITIKNNSPDVEGLNPSVSLFAIDPALTENDVDGSPRLQNAKTFISIMDDPTNFLGNFTGTFDENNNLIIKDSINQSNKIKLNSEVCLLAVANYDDWDKYDPATAEEYARITSYIGTTSHTVSMENAVEFDVTKHDIPVKVEFYKAKDKQNTAYIQMSQITYTTFDSYEAFISEIDLINKFDIMIISSCPEGYDFESKIERDFCDNYATIKIYYNKVQYYGEGTIDVTITDPNTNLLTISATPSEDLCLSCGSIDLGVVLKEDNTDMSTNPQVTWDALILYGGADINDFGTKYYEVQTDNDTQKTSVVLKNTLLVGGHYQLFVSAAYKNMTSSQMFDIEVSDYEYYEYDVTKPDFDSTFASKVSAISNKATIVLSGDLTGSSQTAEERFVAIIQGISKIKTELDVDMSGLSGIDTIPNSYSINAENLKSVKLPGSLTTLPKNAFENSYNLVSITIPATIQDIEGGAFNGCTSLESITFKGEPTVPSFIYENGAVIKIEKDELTEASTKTMVAAIPNIGTSVDFNDFPGVTIIGKEVFNDWKSLVAVDLSGIEEVGESAFYGCSGLTSITNYESLKNVGVAGFRDCNISKFTINENMTLQTNAFASAIDELTIDIEITAENADDIRIDYISKISGVKNIIFNKSAVIPDSTKTGYGWTICQSNANPTPNVPANNNLRPDDTFLYSSWQQLQSIEFKGANSSVGKKQFLNYTNLTQIKTNGNVTSFGDFACWGCIKLTSMNLQGVSYVGTCSFEACTKLSSLELGNTIKQIGQRAFYKSALQGKTITIPASAFAIGADSFWVSSGSQPTIIITHAENPQTETWYSVVWPTTVDNYWTLYIMKPEIQKCPDFPDSSSHVTKIEDEEELNNLDSTIQTMVTGNGNNTSYLRAISSGD